MTRKFKQKVDPIERAMELAIVAGSASNNDSSYLERAKARWGGHSST